jgi:hypothetical protein
VITAWHASDRHMMIELVFHLAGSRSSAAGCHVPSSSSAVSVAFSHTTCDCDELLTIQLASLDHRALHGRHPQQCQVAACIRNVICSTLSLYEQHERSEPVC